MSDELSTPAVIDLEAMLQPVSEENPAGESLRYAGVYDEIAEARRADINVDQGAWQTELKVADYRKVVELAVPALTTQSKDLQIAAWLSESLIKLHGFAGFRDSLNLLTGLQDRFWDTLYPLVDEGDMEGRANAISWMESAASFAIKDCPITAGRGCSLNDFDAAQAAESAASAEGEGNEGEDAEPQRGSADAGNRVTPEVWRGAVAASNRAFYETLNATIEECWTALKELNRVNEERYERNQMPGLSGLNKSLDTVHTRVKKILEAKRHEEPDESDFTAESESGEAGTSSTSSSPGGQAGPIQSRKDAIRRLSEIAAFFTRTEPHSPVAYLVQRAVKWGNMPLESWLQDVIKDESVLFQLRQTLGLETDGGSGSVESWDANASDGAESTANADW